MTVQPKTPSVNRNPRTLAELLTILRGQPGGLYIEIEANGPTWAAWPTNAPAGSEPIASSADFERDHLYRCLVVVLDVYMGQPNRALDIVTI